MERIGGSMSLRTAYQRLRGVEAVLGAKAGRYPSLEVQESAEQKILAFVQGFRDGTLPDEEASESAFEDDPRAVAFLRAIEDYRARRESALV